MLLGPISLLDCAVFVFCLIPQLLLNIALLDLCRLGVQVIPFLLFKLPGDLCYERYCIRYEARSPFCQKATFFQDLVIRCVRYAFAQIPAHIGRVFFSKKVSVPFYRFRLLRHGYLRSPVTYSEIDRSDFRALWITKSEDVEPDVIIYYCHGGGFSMGSSYFYLEFLIAWISLLSKAGYQNPAILALEYTLVPDAKWPEQLEETIAGYRFLLDEFGDGYASRICVSGDSAGATLVLSMLLEQGRHLPRPASAVLLSPWTHLVSSLNQNTASDYLDKDSLHLYAHQYAGDAACKSHKISPGLNRTSWRESSPLKGYSIIFGVEEVFSLGIAQMVCHMKDDGCAVKTYAKDAGIHAWPVVDLFLGNDWSDRLGGLRKMTEFVANTIDTLR